MLAYTEAGKTISSISEKHCSASGKVVHPEDLIAEVKEIYRMAKTMIKNVAQPDVHFAEFSMRYGKSQFPLPKKYSQGLRRLINHMLNPSVFSVGAIGQPRANIPPAEEDRSMTYLPQ